jgi:hypothetical protein
MIELTFKTWEDFDKSIGGITTAVQMMGLERLMAEAEERANTNTSTKD